MNHNGLLIISGSNVQAVLESLEISLGTEDSLPIGSSTPVASLSRRQGSQYSGMGKHFYQDFSQFRSDIKPFDRMG